MEKTNTVLNVTAGIIMFGLIIIGFVTAVGWALNNDTAKDLTVMQYNREIITQQKMIIDSLEERNTFLEKNLKDTVDQANSIIARLQSNTIPTSRTLNN